MMEEVAEPFYVQYQSHGALPAEDGGRAFTVTDTTPIIEIVHTGRRIGNFGNIAQSGKLYKVRKELSRWRPCLHCTCSSYFTPGRRRCLLWTLLVVAILCVAAVVGWAVSPHWPHRQVNTEQVYFVYLRFNNGSNVRHLITAVDPIVTIAAPRHDHMASMKVILDFAQNISVTYLPGPHFCFVREISYTLTPSFSSVNEAVIHSSLKTDGIAVNPVYVREWRTRNATKTERQRLAKSGSDDITSCLLQDTKLVFVEKMENNNFTQEVSDLPCGEEEFYLPTFAVDYSGNSTEYGGEIAVPTVDVISCTNTTITPPTSATNTTTTHPTTEKR